jgi:hypothetical protein
MIKRREALTVVSAALLAVALPLGVAQAERNNQPSGGNPPSAPHVSAAHVSGHSAPHAVHHFSPHFATHAAHHFSRHFSAHIAHHFSSHHFSVRSFSPHRSSHFTSHRFTARHFTSHHNGAPHVALHHAIVPNQTTPSASHLARQLRIDHGHHNGLNHFHGRDNLTRQLRTHTGNTPNAALLSAAHTHHGSHHFRYARVTPHAAQVGRFASRFAGRHDRGRHWHDAAWRAWRHHRPAYFVSWYGPVFWPYAYSDIFDSAFWPYGYDEGYWDYVYDDFFDGVFWGQFGPPDQYVAAGPDAIPAPDVHYAAVQELCKQPGSGVTAWPFAEIERKLDLNDAQKHLLGDVRAAARQAEGVFKASCPSQAAFPLTPPGRLQAMTARLSATLEAVDTVRPSLDAFYNSLSDEQKERFNELGPGRNNNAAASQALPQTKEACAAAKPGLTNLPIQEIAEVVKPTDAQQTALDTLHDAIVQAVSALQAACPQEMPLTPPGRLAAMRTRLKAMIDAANTVKPALDDFYGQLSNEQKARFNRINMELAKGSG